MIIVFFKLFYYHYNFFLSFSKDRHDFVPIPYGYNTVGIWCIIMYGANNKRKGDRFFALAFYYNTPPRAFVSRDDGRGRLVYYRKR